MRNYWLKPDWEPGTSIHTIPTKELVTRNIKALLLDVDGTLLPRNKKLLESPVKDWIIEAKEVFRLHLVSNNPSRERIGNIAKELNIGFTASALKPSTKQTIKAIQTIKYKESNIAIIGDRLFTDILVGNRLGIYTILVKPINQEGKTVKISKFQIFEKSIAKILEI